MQLKPHRIGRILAGLFALLSLSIASCASRGLVTWPMPEPGSAGSAWTTLRAWDFADGPCPGGWGWGAWRVVDGCLELTGDAGGMAVYFVPAVHGADFRLETRLQFVDVGDGAEVRAHLLTRDGNRLVHESGLIQSAAGRASVRHMVNNRDHVLQIVPSALGPGDDGWHDLKFSVRDGRIEARVDGRPVFAADRSGPAGYYAEPHLAAEHGTIRFRDLRISIPEGERIARRTVAGDREAPR